MEGHCSTGQSPQWAVVQMEEEEEEEEDEKEEEKKTKKKRRRRRRKEEEDIGAPCWIYHRNILRCTAL